jgi:hypothetical protein
MGTGFAADSHESCLPSGTLRHWCIGELLALRWRDVDLATGLVRVEETVYEDHFDGRP